MNVEKTIEFILEMQAKTEARFGKTEEQFARAEERFAGPRRGRIVPTIAWIGSRLW